MPVQLRAIQARRDRAWRERRAKVLAAELEAAFGDGTVVAWQGLQEAGVEQALRGALARQRPPSGSLKASLQRLLAMPFWGGKGEKPGDWSVPVEKDAARLLRRRGHPRQLPDLVATQARGRCAHALTQSKLPDKVRLRRGTAVAGRARGGPGLGDSSQPWAGPMLATVEDVQAGQETGASGGSCFESAGPTGGVERSAGSLVPPRLVGSRRKGSRDRVSQVVSGHSRRLQRRAGNEAYVGGASKEGSGAAVERAHCPGPPLSWTMGEDRKEAAADLRRGVLVAAVLQHTRHGLIAPGGRTGPRGSGWQGAARVGRLGEAPAAARQRGGEASEGAMQRWLAQLGTGKLSAGSSPRTVIVPQRREGPAEASSPDASPLGSRTPSLSSSEVSTRGTALPVREEWPSPARSSTSEDVRGSLSEVSSVEEAGPTDGAVWGAALQSASTLAAALAVAMHLVAHGQAGSREATQAGPPRVPAPAVLLAAARETEQVVGLPKSEGGVSPRKAGPCSGGRLEARPGAELSGTAAVPASSAAHPPAHQVAAGRQEAPPCVAGDGNALTAVVARDGRSSRAPMELLQNRPQLAVTSAGAGDLPTQPQTSGRESRPACQLAAGPEGKPADGTGPLTLLQQGDHAGPELRPAAVAAPGALGKERPRAATAEKGGQSSPGPALLVAMGQYGEGEQGADQLARTHQGAEDVAGAPATDAAGTAEAHLDAPGSPSHSSSAETVWCDAEADPVSAASTAPSCAASGVAGLLERRPLATGGCVRPIQRESAPIEAGSAEAVRASLGSAAAGAVSPASEALGHRSGEGPCSTAGRVGAGGQGSKEAEQSKKYGWWRWTVGCVLGGVEDAGTRERGDRVRSAAVHGKRRVVPLDVDELQ